MDGRERIRTATIFVFALTTVVATLNFALVPASASCAAPILTIPREVTAGSMIFVSGERWADRCNDTPSACSLGNRVGPATRIGLGFTPPRARLARVDANQDGRFGIALRVPRLSPGSYLLFAVTPRGIGTTAPITIVAGPGGDDQRDGS